MTFCVWLDDARAATAEIGGKARSLRRLAAAGLPVPRAFAVTADLARALRAAAPAPPTGIASEADVAAALATVAALGEAPWPAGFARELEGALARLTAESDARVSVRSSAALEDRADALGAGLFVSRTNVAAAHVAAAVREVVAAAAAPAPLAYAARRGLPADALAMAVLVHAFIPGDASGTVAFDAEAQDAPTVDIADVEAGSVSAPARARVVEAARRLAASDGPVELEWVATGDDVLFLQLRPYRAPRGRPWSGASALGDGAWEWDAAHNPLPLSAAQAGLVALVDARCHTPFRQRVVGGYLFFTRAQAPDAPTELARAAQTLNEAERALAALPLDATLERALDVFVSIYGQIFGVVQAAASAARAALAAFLRAHARPETPADLLRGVPSLATERARRAQAIVAAPDAPERAAAVDAYLALFGDEAAVWDVATPTHSEDPTALERLAPRASRDDVRESEPTPTPTLPGEGQALLAAARAAVAIGEDDDVLYARAQARVRRALLREGERLQAASVLARAADVFWLPLDLVRAHARGDAALAAAAVTHAIADARDARAAALADPPPLAGAGPAGSRGGVRGHAASSGRAIGPVHIHDPARPAPVPPGAVLVARTLLPTELPLYAPAAIIVETGGVLGHVAAQARERALPALVDAAHATTAFRNGDQVLVDAEAGLAIRLG